MDNRTPEERRRNMSAVRSSNTQPELKLRKALWRNGLRYFTTKGWQNLTGQRLPGSPDIVFPSPRLVVFVDGCFWHGCPEHYQAPMERREFWERKLAVNRARDERANEELHKAGWRVVRIWEHEVRAKVLNQTVARLLEEIKQDSWADVGASRDQEET